MIKDPIIPPAGSGNASANWVAVTVYVAKSPNAAAKNTHIPILIFLFLQNLNIKYDTIGPTIAIEKALAPSVVSPPWANNIAWNNKAIVPITAITAGPNNIAPKPTPVGCEQLPVNDGILRADNTNTNAPAKANNTFFLGSFFTIVFIDFNPYMKNGINTMVQNIDHFTGK